MFVSTDITGALSANMYAYCENNPVLYVDSSGSIPSLIMPADAVPWFNGLQEGYYSYTYNSKGEFYEYWYDSNGNLLHARHHSDHGNSRKHANPHDHDGGNDDKGNNTLTSGPLPVDKNYQKPKDNSNNKVSQAIGGVAVVTIAGALTYEAVKWIGAVIAAIPSGGTSIAFALLTP